MENFEDFMGEVFDVNINGRKHGEGKVIKSYPADADEISLHHEMDDITKNIMAIFQIQVRPLAAKVEAKKSLFWGKIRERLKEYSDHLHFNEETNEVEVIEDDNRHDSKR